MTETPGIVFTSYEEYDKAFKTNQTLSATIMYGNGRFVPMKDGLIHGIVEWEDGFSTIYSMGVLIHSRTKD